MNSPLNLILILLLALCYPCSARDPEKIALWNNQAPTGEGKVETVDAFITIHRPVKPNGTSAIICPGGGYGGLVTGPEGSGIAQWLNQQGVTGIVLEYRLPNGRPFVPLLDAQRAIRTVRSRAKSWDCDPARIGIIGFSAGGHLASMAATHFDSGNAAAPDPIDRVSCRPDFAVLVYPVITMGDKTHQGSKRNLLGATPTAELVNLFSNEKQITTETPPTYLAHAVDDRAVPCDNSRMFHEALTAQNIATHYLELPRGDHGLNGYKGPMWDAWQSGSLQWLRTLKLMPGIALPSYEALNESPMRVQLLPGHRDFTFTIYGTPGPLDQLKALVETMQREKLGNGFDPGPGVGPSSQSHYKYLRDIGWPVIGYAQTADHQVKEGTCRMSDEQDAILRILDDAGIFTATQIAEWGYYFHNLSHRESWWHAVYGADFDKHKPMMKPAGLAGYDTMPTSRRECYDIVNDYFKTRQNYMRGWNLSITGHSHYEAYVGQWGAKVIGLELGENIAFTQSKMAFARGAARRNGLPWSIQVSQWFNGSSTSNGSLKINEENGTARGLDAGHSLSFYQRMWLHAWFAGTAMVTPEASIDIFFEKERPPFRLTSPHGEKASETFQLMRSKDRGIPYMPVAIVLDQYCGYNAYMGKPWGILEPTSGDLELRDLFQEQLFPGSDHIHRKPFPENPEASYLRPTPFGEIFDVHLSDAPPEVLASYPVIVVAGDHAFENGFIESLTIAADKGSRILIANHHVNKLTSIADKVETLKAWTNPATGRSTAISNARLKQLGEEFLPATVQGDPVLYQFNRTTTGWIIELVNNNGVTKFPTKPAVIDSNAMVSVSIAPNVAFDRVLDWRTGEPLDSQNTRIAPGETVFVELVTTE